MKFRLAAAAVACAALTAVGVVTATPAVSLGKIKCKDTTGLTAVDPIVFHNKPLGSGHLHQFFGNASWLSMANPNTANYSDLVGKSTNCADPADTAGYWIPALVDTRSGKTLTPQAFTAYYRTFDSKTRGSAENATPFPPDTRLVAMQNSVSPGASGWSCGQKTSTPMQSTIPDCSRYSQKPGEVLTAHINFPSCWNGVKPSHTSDEVGDARDNANYAYPVRSGKSWVCPSTFPVKMVQLRETIQFPNPGKIPAQYLAVASDEMMGGKNGSTMHADFWNTWKQSGLETMVQDCIVGSARSSLCG